MLRYGINQRQLETFGIVLFIEQRCDDFPKQILAHHVACHIHSDVFHFQHKPLDHIVVAVEFQKVRAQADGRALVPVVEWVVLVGRVRIFV